MKIEEMENEQLVDDLIDAHILGHPLFKSSGDLKTELLTRLDRGDRAIKAMAALEAEVKRLNTSLQYEISIRPEWAKGYTDESIAYQVNHSALSSLYTLLNVDNQTKAVEVVKRLTEENENLRCCGNCVKYKYLTTIGCYNKTMFPCDSCADWQSDKMIKAEREG